MRTINLDELSAEGVDETIVAASIHDSKPLCFLSSSFTEIRCVQKTKKAWAQEKDSMAQLEFLWLPSAENCNHGMKEVDVSNQKRRSHPPDRLIRETKW